MAAQVVFGKSYELVRRRNPVAQKYLLVDVGAEVLHSYFIESSF